MIVPEVPGFNFTERRSFKSSIRVAAGLGPLPSLTIGGAGNPLAHEMVPVLQENRAAGFIAGPNTTDDEAVLPPVPPRAAKTEFLS